MTKIYINYSENVVEFTNFEFLISMIPRNVQAHAE